MNEIVDELRALNEDRFGSVELPDFDRLVEIEEQLLIKLPDEFKELLMTVSDVVYGSIEPVTATDENLHTFLPDVAFQAWDIGVPRHLIPICQKGQSYYCVEQDGQVVLWKKGKLTDDEWDSVWHWAKEVWLEQ